MDFSKLKFEIYDFLGIILPGLIAICEGWVFVRGWDGFTLSVQQLGAGGLTMIAVFAFGVGNLVQECGDVMVKTWKGKRFFRHARDSFWAHEESVLTKVAIRKDFGSEITSVDVAFDYCLTKLEDRFAKRDVFLATSDLSRSLALLCVLAIIPAVSSTWQQGQFSWRTLVNLILFGAFLLLLASLGWRRMVRFRELSETTVFHAYLATFEKSDKSRL